MANKDLRPQACSCIHPAGVQVKTITAPMGMIATGRAQYIRAAETMNAYPHVIKALTDTSIEIVIAGFWNL